ncbi:haloacid dehalogenase-like hydrolase domain-containing protein Sgpp [Tanacetum coccineum]|uniref:Haloacid dehalogenase-like hydrolase domain-containing protein Sgpp n=1 Tax=Tanacetum coccineum TaxID=301880 RepID=A0ABQ5DTK3_9ASTR
MVSMVMVLISSSHHAIVVYSELYIMANLLEAVLFDVDGTLCDSDPIHHIALCEILLEVQSSTDKEKIDELDARIQDRLGEGVSPSNASRWDSPNVSGQNFVWVCCSRWTEVEEILVLSSGSTRFTPSLWKLLWFSETVSYFKKYECHTKIIKPIEHSMSKLNDLRDILVTFLVLRVPDNL